MTSLKVKCKNLKAQSKQTRQGKEGYRQEAQTIVQFRRALKLLVQPSIQSQTETIPDIQIPSMSKYNPDSRKFQRSAYNAYMTAIKPAPRAATAETPKVAAEPVLGW